MICSFQEIYNLYVESCHPAYLVESDLRACQRGLQAGGMALLLDQDVQQALSAYFDFKKFSSGRPLAQD